jgi:hypothetical protein
MKAASSDEPTSAAAGATPEPSERWVPPFGEAADQAAVGVRDDVVTAGGALPAIGGARASDRGHGDRAVLADDRAASRDLS